MKQAFDAQVLSLQAEQQRVQQDNVHLLDRLNTLPTPMSSGSPWRLDCPTFGSEHEAVDSKLGLHEFHACRVQVVAWHAESTLAVSTCNVQVFTKLRGRAAHVVAAKVPLDSLRTDQGFQGLLGILEWAYGADTAVNILQAVVGLLECKRGDSDMLTWMNRLDMLVYRLANFGIVLDERLSGMLALLNSNLNADQRAMVVASTGRSLVFSQVLVAVRQLFPGGSTSRLIDCMFGADGDFVLLQHGGSLRRVPLLHCRPASAVLGSPDVDPEVAPVAVPDEAQQELEELLVDEAGNELSAEEIAELRRVRDNRASGNVTHL